MRKTILATALMAALLGSSPELAAQSAAIDLTRFDIVGVKLGQTIQEAVAALKKHNPRFRIDIRRVGLQKWDNQPGCIEDVVRQGGGGGFGTLPSNCGNWSDGMRFGPQDLEEQKKIRPEDSLIAGIVAYDDQREFGPPRKIPDFHLPVRDLIRAGEETIGLVVTPEPGKEKVVLISRAKSYPENSVSFDDIKAQVFERYAAPASVIQGLQTSPPNISILNLFVGGEPLTKSRNQNAFAHCSHASTYEYNPADSDFLMLQPSWPNRIGARCGDVIQAHVRSFSNSRYAHGFSVIWFEQQALSRLSRDRVLVAKAMRDAQFKGSPPLKKKETF